MRKYIYFTVLLLFSFYNSSFAQTPNWTSNKETTINPNGSNIVDIFANGYGNHIIVNEEYLLKYYRIDANGNTNLTSNIETVQTQYSSISGNSDNIYVVYKITSSNNIKIKHSTNGGITWLSTIPQISLSSSPSNIESIVSNNKLHVVYSVSNLIKYKIYNISTGIWSSELPASLTETGKAPRITAFFNGTVDRIYFLWARNTSNEGRWREYDAMNNQWVNSPQTAFSFSDPSTIDFSSTRAVAVDENYIYTYFGYYYKGAFYPNMRGQQRLKSNNQLVYITRDMTVKSLSQMFSTTTPNNVSHVAYYYSDWIPSDNLEIGIVRNKHNGMGIDWDVVWAHNFNDNPPNIINISSSSNDVYVIWKDITSSYLRFIYDDQVPLAPVNLTVIRSSTGHPLLNWTKNNEADIQYYQIYKWSTYDAGWVPYATSLTNSYQDPYESMCPTGQYCESGHNIQYKVTAVDYHPFESAASNAVIINVLGGAPDKIVVNPGNQTATFEYSLVQNYPNPFNPSTKISYSIKEEGLVTLKIYDVLGKEVATLVNENKPEGNYEVEFNASELPSGMYIYKLQAGSFSDVKKMLLTK